MTETTKPIVPWDADPSSFSHKDIIWFNMVYERYLIEVRRKESYSGELLIFDHKKNDEEITRWNVSLSYGAKFGVDADDIYEWTEKIMDFIDNAYNKE